MPSLVLRPEPMTRIAVVAPKAVQKEVIEALHDARLAHIEEFAKGDAPDLKIGEPLPEGSRTSELLVKIRSLVHTLDLEGAPSRSFRQEAVRTEIETALPELSRRVRAAAEERDTIARELDSVREQRAQLEPLQGLALALEDYGGYDTLEVFVGTAPRDLRGELGTALERFEYFASEDAHAVFVVRAQADKAQDILTREGFRELEVPDGRGSVSENMARLERDAAELEARLIRATEQLAGIAAEHRDLLLAAEEDLSIEVEKAEAPLGFASTERAFIVDAWVPSEDLDRVKTQVDAAARGKVHFEVLSEPVPSGHHHGDEPPVKYDHPKGVRRFGFLLDVYSRPKYSEIDPTLVLFLVFPLFFGFMIGDLGYGILMVALGLFLYRRIGEKSDGAKSFGFALLLSGIWASIFGAVVFHDVLGIPFAPHGDGHGLSWEGLTGIHFHDMLGGPMIEKLGDEGVKAMLALSILAAFVHLFVGFLFGFVNEVGHSRKHAGAKVAWMFVLTAFFLTALVMGPENAVSDYFLALLGHPTINHAVLFLVPGVLGLVVTEGAIGVMETLGLLSNVISYTRLAGVAVAKGAMAGAFNFIFLEEMVLHGEGVAILVIGFILFVLAQLIVFVLGLISSGIQSIRLNYVEFFLKFYKGGGEPFAPFGRVRQFTLNPTTK